ncbi:MAG: hypothetical protein RL302_2459, partial [Pseudomonadota bacterium]
CLKRAPLDKRLRLLGVRVGSLLNKGLASVEYAQAATNLIALPTEDSTGQLF